MATGTLGNLNKRSLAAWMLHALLFVLVFSVIPFYTNTQNTYFLQGLAQAGYGWLAYDWQSATVDSKPFFSIMVRLVYQWLGMGGFYLLFVLLLGVYFNSIITIIHEATHHFFKKNRSYQFFLLTGLLVIHAHLVYVLMEAVTGNYYRPTFLEGFAHQSVLDRYLQPQTVGVFLFLSIALFLKKQYFKSVSAACFAALIHISYILPAALITLLCMGYLYVEEKNIRKSVLAGLLGLLVVSPMLLYTLYELFPLSASAIDILYDYRIPHHANPYYWFPEEKKIAVVRVVLMLVAMYVVRKHKPLLTLYGVLFAGALGLTLLQMLTGSKNLGLLFPWRISTVLVPLASCFLYALLLRHFLQYFQLSLGAVRWLRMGSYVLIALLAAGGVFSVWKKVLEKNESDALLQEIRYAMALPENESFCVLIPAELGEFRLVTGLPAFIDYKSHPYQSEELATWYARMTMNEKFYQHQMAEAEIAALLQQYQVLYILTYAGNPLPDSRYYRKAYANQGYILYATK